MLLTLAAAAWALRTDRAPERRTAYLVVFVAALLYVPVAIWHFIGHVNGDELDVAHVLLAVTQVATIVGAIVATTRSRRTSADLAYGPGE
jgi:hypothetical protein